MKLKDRVALVTGASRGIGRAVAETFAAQGASLFLVGHTDHEALNQALTAVRERGMEAEGLLADVGDYQAVQGLADAIERRFGVLDIVVNNAGNIQPTPLLETSAEQWDRTIKTHLYGTFYCTVEMVARFLKPRGGGKIINLTAPAALRGSLGVAAYAAAKGGIISFTKNAARELRPFNIQVNAILPIARSRMTDVLEAYFIKTLGAPPPRLRALPGPEALGPAFLFLASSDSDYVTGQVLTADGGLLDGE